jgi:hypothetical protein
MEYSVLHIPDAAAAAAGADVDVDADACPFVDAKFERSFSNLPGWDGLYGLYGLWGWDGQ